MTRSAPVEVSEETKDPWAAGRCLKTSLASAREAFAAGKVLEAYTELTRISERVACEAAPNERIAHDLLLGKVCRERGDYEGAEEAFGRALSGARSEALPAEEADALNGIASIETARGNTIEALTHLEQAGNLFAQLRMESKQADVLNNIGHLHYLLSDLQSALISLREAHELLRSDAPVSRSAAINLQSLGRTYAALGEHERAERLHLEALELHQQLDDPLIEIVSRLNLAEIYLTSARLDQALKSFVVARSLSESHGFAVFAIHAVEGIGDVLFRGGDYEEAIKNHRSAVDMARSVEDPERIVSCTLKLARDHLAHGNSEQALEHAHEALAVAERGDADQALIEAHALLADAYKTSGDFEAVVHHLEASHRIERELFDEKSDARARHLMIRFDVEKARFEAEEYRLKSEVARRAREEAEELVAARTRELEDAQVEIVTRLAVAAEYRDDDTGEHTRRVGRTAAVLAYVLARPIDDVRLIYNAARLHDVGKIGISDTILHKPAKLTDEEFAKVKTHPTIGAKILADGHSPLLHMAERIAIGHHERWDGRGYPDRVAGDAIPLEARIVAVADVLDALLHERPYKEAWPLDEAIAEIERNGGSQFDPQVVEAALAAFGPSGPFSPQDVSSGWEDLRRELARVEHLRERFAARAERDPRAG